MDSEFDRKIFAYLLKGPTEFNNVQRIIDFSTLVEAIHFDLKSLGKIVLDYYTQYRMPPTISLLKENIVEDYEVIEVLIALESEACEESEVKYYIDQVRKRYNAYLARTLSDSIAYDEESFDHDEFNTSLGKIQSKISRLYKSAVFTEGSIQTSVDERFGRYLYTEQNPEQITGVFSGYRELDMYTWGIKESEMLVISGASSSGKSLLMMNIGINAWLGSNNPLVPGQNNGDGKNVLFFSLEMNKSQIENRLDANLAGVPINSIVRGKLTEQEKARYQDSLKFCRNYPNQFYICDMPRGTRMIDIEARYEVICSEFKPDLVCIDYLGIMKPNLSKNQDWLDVGYVAEEMAEFCRSKNIPVITAAQRKAKDKKAKKQYQDNEEIGRSKLIGDNANIHFLIEDRDEEYLREDMIIHIAKNRDGAKGKVTLLKDFERAKIISPPDNWVGDTGSENAF